MKWGLALFIALFTIAALWLRGYEYGSGDQTHYLVFIEKKINPSLYKDDFLVQTRDQQDSIFVEMMTFLATRVGNLEVAVFFMYMVCLFIFYLALYQIGYALWHDRYAAVLSLILLIPIYPIGGSSIVTFDSYLTLRTIAHALLLSAVYFLMKRRWWISIFLAGIGFLFHPLTLLPFPIILATLLLSIHKPPRFVVKAVSVFSLIISPLLLRFLSRSNSDPIFLDPTWRSILEQRVPYAFALQWSWQSWVISIIYIFVFVIGLIQLQQRNKTFMATVLKVIGLVCLVLLVIHLAGDIFSLSFIIKLQLTRSLYLVAILSIVLFAGVVRQTSQSFTQLTLVLVVAVVVFFEIFHGNYLKIPYIQPRNDFELAAQWIRLNSSPDSKILIPPVRSGFRFFARRAVVTEYKEGAESLYSRSFALEWQRRQSLLKEYYSLKENDFLKIKENIHFDYLVTRAGLSLPVSFTQGEWTIYNLSQTH